MEYLGLSIKYFRKNLKIFYLLILSIAISVGIVFSFQVVKRSQNINNMNYLKQSTPTYNAESRNLDEKTTEKIKNHKNVKIIETYKNLGNFIENKTKGTFSLSEYNTSVIKSYKFDLVEGSEPKNSNEIVIEKEFASRCNLKTGDHIDGKIKKEYISNGSHNLFMEKKSFEIVGIIQSKYKTNELCQVFTKSSENLIPKEAISYDSKINLKTGFNDLYSNTYKLGNDVGQSQNTVLANELHQRLVTAINSQSIQSPDHQRVVIVSVLFVSSVFALFMRKRLKDIGLIRIVGGSKIGFSVSTIFENLFIAFIGCVIGVILGYCIAFFLNKNVYLGDTFEFISPEDRKLYVNWKDIILAVKMSLASVSISIIIQLITLNFSKELDLVENRNCFDKIFGNINILGRNPYFIKKLTSKLAFKNFTRILLPMLISIIIVMFASGRWFHLLIVYKLDETGIPRDTINRYQSRNTEITPENDNNLNDNNLQGLKNIEGVSDILKLKQINGYGVIPKHLLSNEMKSNNDEQGITDELIFTITGYEKYYFKDKDVFSSGGYEDIYKDDLSILITESFYDRYNGAKNSKIFKNLKVGDTIKVKLPVVENELEKYKTFDVKVAGILNEQWSVYKDSPFRYGEIVFDINKLKEITKSDTYTNIKFNYSGDLKNIENKFNEKNYTIDSIKEIEKMDSESDKKFHNELMVITIFFIMIAFTNVYSTIKGNIMLRKKEISIIRSLGASQKTVYKMIIKESLIYGFVCAMAGSIYGILRGYNSYKKNIITENQVSGFSTAKFEIPILQLIIFFIITLIFCFIISNISLRPVLKENIVDGIKNGE